LALSVGWTQDYLDNEDLEAERLFDYGVLAPVPLTSERGEAGWEWARDKCNGCKVGRSEGVQAGVTLFLFT